MHKPPSDFKGKKVSHNPFAEGEIYLSVPTTESQREIWGALETDPETTLCYNESIRLSLNGTIDTDLLKKAYHEVIKRHDSLRGVFSFDGKYFSVTSRFDLPLEKIDLSIEKNKNERLEQLYLEETKYKFNLVMGPGVKASIVKLDEQNHTFVMTAHHILCDGWSFAVVLTELSQIYSSLVNGTPILDKWPNQFNNYAMVELNKGINQKDRDFWVEQFSTNIPDVNLPLDFERPEFRTYDSKRTDYKISTDLVKGLKKVGAKNGASFYNSLFSVFQVLLKKISKKRELVVGISIAAQSAIGADDLVGHMVNLLPIKHSFDDNDDFIKTLKKIKNSMFDAFDHQSFTFGSLLKELRLERDISRIPLIDIIFNVDQQYPGQGLEFDDIEAEYSFIPRHFENFEIFINATSCGDDLVLECQYNTNLFKDSTIQNWLESYERLIEILIKDSDALIDDLSLADLFIPSYSQKKGEQKNQVVVTNSEDEKRVALIWEQTLELEGIPHDANFFSIGGHSLLAVEMTSRIFNEFGIQLGLKDIFQSATIAQLALLVSIDNKKEVDKLYSLQAGLTEGIDIIPSSMNQQQVWFLDQLSPESTVHVLPGSIRVRTHIERKVLEDSFNFLIKRHGSLRTSFDMLDGQLCQYILNKDDSRAILSLDEEPIDFCNVKEAIAKEASKGFDLKKAPLFRAKLYKLDEDDYVLFYLVHHIIWDGWSYDIYLKELDIIYRAFLRGEKPELETENRVSYGDYTVWNQSYLNSPVIAAQTSYWTKKLSGELPILELPSDFKRPVKISKRAGNIPFSFDKDFIAELRAFAQSQKVSFFNLLLTGYKITLAQYSGINDIIVGAPVRGRNDVKLEKTIGHFVNTIALRSEIDLEKSFVENLSIVSKNSLDAFGNQEVPFDSVLKEVQWDRDPGRTPVYQCFFTFQDINNRSNMMAGVKYEYLNVVKSSAHTDLDLWVRTSDDKLNGGFEYRLDLFEKVTIERFSEYFINVLKLMLKKGNQKVNSLSLLPKSQEELLLNSWNDTATESFAEKSFHQCFEQKAMATPNAIAVISKEAQLTYKELDQKANDWACELIKLGVKSGDLVGLSSTRNTDMLVSLIAILKTGAGYVPLDPGFPQDRLDYMVESSQIKVLLTMKSLGERFNSSLSKLYIEDLSVIKTNSEKPIVEFDESHTAYVIYTSGSTGKPKGVQLPHKAVLNFLKSMQVEPGFSTGDKLLAVTTLSFDIAVLELYLPLVSGGCVYISSKEEAMDGEALKKIIETEKITIMQATPSTWRLLLNAGWSGDKNFKLLCGGEAFPKDLVEKLIPIVGSVWNMYGPTETTVWSTCKKLSLEDRSLLVGRPIANTSVYILDENMKPLPIGSSGELYIGGFGLADGYRGRPDLTEKVFVNHPLKPNEKIYNTGDLAKFNFKGELECLGRNDGQVKVRGYRIELGEIEVSLSKIAGIHECVVITREDRPGDVRIVAYYIVELTNTFDQFKAREQMSKTLPVYMIPSHFIELKEFPKTLNEKIDKKRLPAPLLKKTKNEVKPNIENNEKLRKSISRDELRQIWKDLLVVESIEDHDQFFDVGGHSILSVQLFAKIRAKFKVNLPMATLFEAPTINKLALVIDKHINANKEGNSSLLKSNESQGFSSLVRIRNTADSRGVFCFHGVGGNVLNYNILTKYIEPQRPVYGLQSVSVDGLTEPILDIKVMACQYIKEMKEVQPKGPYTLLGGSMGGMIALEVAQQLKVKGDEVDKLIMLDTTGPGLDVVKYGVNKISFFRRVKEALVSRSKKYMNNLMVQPFKILGKPIPHTLRYNYVERYNYIALWAYKPLDYYGAIELIRGPLRKSGIYSDPFLGWEAKIQGTISTHIINGSHNNFVESEELGPILKSIFK